MIIINFMSKVSVFEYVVAYYLVSFVEVTTVGTHPSNSFFLDKGNEKRMIFISVKGRELTFVSLWSWYCYHGKISL